MKEFLSITLLLLTVEVYAQIPGYKIKGPIDVKGVKVDEGDTLYLGTGTNPNGFFKFIIMPQNAWVGTGETSLNRQFANTRLVVKFIKELKSKKIGNKYFLVVNPGGFNYMVDLDPAIEAGEVVAINQTRFSVATLQTKSISTADELLKYKQLLDAGAITQSEYEAQKKKLLGN